MISVLKENKPCSIGLNLGCKLHNLSIEFIWYWYIPKEYKSTSYRVRIRLLHGFMYVFEKESWHSGICWLTNKYASRITAKDLDMLYYLKDIYGNEKTIVANNSRITG